MRNVTVQVAQRLEDLKDLPEGTRIATNNNQLFELEETPVGLAWLEPGALEPFHHPLPQWLPAYIVPRKRGII